MVRGDGCSPPLSCEAVSPQGQACNHVYADEAVLTVTVPATQTTAKAITAHVLYKMVEGCLTDEADVFPAA